jgi:hypothetical protein
VDGESAGSVRDNSKEDGGDTVTGARAGTKVRSATAVLALPIVSVAATVRRRTRRWWWLPGWLFAAITLVPALLAMAWLVPGTAILLAGRLLPLPALIIFVPLALALCYFAMRQLPVRWLQLRAGRTAERRRADVPVAAVLATVAIAAGLDWSGGLSGRAGRRPAPSCSRLCCPSSTFRGRRSANRWSRCCCSAGSAC